MKEIKDTSLVETKKKEKETINRSTVVTVDNLREVAERLFRLPCAKALQCSTVAELESLISTECIIYGIPLAYFLDGSYRRLRDDKRVTYFGQVAVQVYTYMAQKSNLPTVTGINVRYILDNVKLTVSLQKVFDKISAASKLKGCNYASLITDPEYKDLNLEKYSLPAGQRFVIVPKDQIYCADQYSHTGQFLYCLAGAYNIIGAIGQLLLSDGTKFDYKYELDPTVTKLQSERSGAPSAYSKNPLQFIATKFNRHAMRNYYNTLISSVPQSSDDDEVDIDFDYECQLRENQIVDKVAKTEQKIKEINERHDFLD